MLKLLRRLPASFALAALLLSALAPWTQAGAGIIDKSGIEHPPGRQVHRSYPPRQTPSLWYIETVDAVGVIGRYCSLALDPEGYPHISYSDWTHRDLKVAHLDGSGLQGQSWRIEVIDEEGEVGAWTFLAIDQDGRPHISYMGNWSLKYAWYDGVSRVRVTDRRAWQIETVDDSRITGYYSSLARDEAGLPHIAYQDRESLVLKYAHAEGTTPHTGRAWQIETVDDTEQVGRYPSLALDRQDHPHIAYGHGGNGDLKYAHYDGANWHIEVVDDSGVSSSFISLALDTAGRAHISYFDSLHYNLKYARRSESNLGQTQGWQIETVDDDGRVGAWTSLALDAVGQPHISYCRYDLAHLTCTGLKYARRSGEGWQIEMVDGVGSVGRYSSLALDVAGRPHIAYYADSPDNNLKYALGAKGVHLYRVYLALAVRGGS